MNEDKTIKNVLKVVGIAALVAVPVFLFLKNRRQQETESAQREDSNIFGEELRS